MPINVSCACGKVLRLADDKQGKRVRCPACQGVLTVGGAASQARREPANRTDVAETKSAPGPGKKSKTWVYLLSGCLGLVLLGCAGSVGAVVLLVGLGGSSSPEGKLAGKWVLDGDATLQVNPAFSKGNEDIRFDFQKGGTASWGYGGPSTVKGTWKKVGGDKKNLQLELFRGQDRTSPIKFPVVFVDDDHIRIDYPEACQLRREGAPATPSQPSPQRDALAKQVVGKWAWEEGGKRDAWELNSDGSAKFTSSSAPSWNGKYRVVGDGLLEVDVLGGTTV
ncbi:MAG TPA: hypothetical protein VFE78_35440, partial [Gemmataceae bacterium]|nr:hypothetical protein [Gemmataceae bacterium]